MLSARLVSALCWDLIRRMPNFKTAREADEKSGHWTLGRVPGANKNRCFDSFGNCLGTSQQGLTNGGLTVMFEMITFLIQNHFKTVTVTVISGKLIQMTFKMVIGNQWK